MSFVVFDLFFSPTGSSKTFAFSPVRLFSLICWSLFKFCGSLLWVVLLSGCICLDLELILPFISISYSYMLNSLQTKMGPFHIALDSLLSKLDAL